MADPQVNGEGGPAAFFERACERFARAVDATAAVEADYEIMGRTVRICFAGLALEGALTASLAHRITPASSNQPTLTLCAWDARSTGVGLPDAAWPATAYGAKGVIDGFNNERFSTVFAPGVDLFNMFDRERGVGLFFVEDAREVPYWEKGFPFRTLFHWSTAGTARQLVHSGAVGVEGSGVLVTGVGGSGKSTTTLLCLEAGLDFAGDDYVAFELASPPVVHSLYSSAKVDAATLARFPGFSPLVHNRGTDDEKSLLFLHPTQSKQLTASMELQAILLPRVTGERDTRVVPASSAKAVQALAPTTVFQLPRQDREAFSRMVALSRSVPSYTLELGHDLSQIPPLVAGVAAGRAL